MSSKHSSIEELEPIDKSHIDLMPSSVSVNLRDKIFQELDRSELDELIENLPTITPETDEIWTTESISARLRTIFPELNLISNK